MVSPGWGRSPKLRSAGRFSQVAARLVKRMHRLIDKLGMIFDLGDKASVRASDRQVLDDAQRATGKLAGMAVGSVREVGVNYALWVRQGGSERPVFGVRARG